LVGSFAHLRPDNPQTFIASITGVLSQYPLGLVEECVDPRCGIARKVEFLSIKSLVDWLDRRLAFYRSLASYTPRLQLPEREFTDEECERGHAAIGGLRKAIVDGTAADLTFERAVEMGQEPI
jgi:hypothetical protein